MEGFIFYHLGHKYTIDIEIKNDIEESLITKCIVNGKNIADWLYTIGCDFHTELMVSFIEEYENYCLNEKQVYRRVG